MYGNQVKAYKQTQKMGMTGRGSRRRADEGGPESGIARTTGTMAEETGCGRGGRYNRRSGAFPGGMVDRTIPARELRGGHPDPEPFLESGALTPVLSKGREIDFLSNQLNWRGIERFSGEEPTRPEGRERVDDHSARAGRMAGPGGKMTGAGSGGDDGWRPFQSFTAGPYPGRMRRPFHSSTWPGAVPRGENRLPPDRARSRSDCPSDAL